MDIPKPFHNLPEWGKSSFEHKGEEGDEWKDQPKLKRARKLYEQTNQIYTTAQLFCHSLTGERAEGTEGLIMQNAMMLGAKIVGAEGGDIYILKMENASIIRTNCRELLVQVRWAGLSEMCNPEYAKLLLNEIEKFRLLFVDWVSGFEKDDVEDEWGLY